MAFARRVFTIAGIYGLIVTLPLLAGPERFARNNPPPLTHPVFYYGFAGTVLAWQLAFLVIGRDPVRYRLLILPSIVEKVVFGVAAVALYLAAETSLQFLVGAVVDLVLGALFILCWFRTAPEAQTAG
jgi:hypothetical protein